MFQKNTLQTFIKALTTLGFILISLSIYILLIVPPASGYEVSIYGAYPVFFWFLLIAAISCGIIVLVILAFEQELSLWKRGYLLVLFTNGIILLLPIFRGYATLGRGDVLTHIGRVKDILFTGHFPVTGGDIANFYPAVHVLVAAVSFITGLTPEFLAMLIPGFFTIFYMVSIHLLSKELTSSWGEVLLITAFGALLIYKHENLMLAPSVQCFYLLPLTLFLLYRAQLNDRVAYSLLLVLLLFITPFYHPGEGTLLLAITILCLKVSVSSYRKVVEYKTGSIVTVAENINLVRLGLILFITWFTWFSSFSAFNSFKRIWNWLVYGIGEPTFVRYEILLKEVDISYSQFLELFLKMWGHAAIYCLLAIAISMLIWKRVFFSSKYKIEKWQFCFSLLFITFVVLGFICFFADIWLKYNRELRYTLFAATILNGLGYNLFYRWRRKIAIVTIISLLIATATIGVFNTYPSPIIKQDNSQVTSAEMNGMHWFLSHQNTNLLIDNIYLTQHRFAHAIKGLVDTPHNIRFKAISPYHFGYNESKMYGDFYNNDRYFIDSKISRLHYPVVLSEYRHLWKFTPDDFKRLELDLSVSKVYSNGEFWTYYIHGQKQ